MIEFSKQRTPTRETSFFVRNCDVYAKTIGDGPVILFIHGWLHSSEIWTKLFAEIPNNYRLIALDLPSFGKSKPLDRDQININTYIEIVEHIVKTITINHKLYAIVGDSLGGLLVLNLLLTRNLPETRILLSGCPIDGLPFLLNILRIRGLITLSLMLLKKTGKMGRTLIKYFSFPTISNPKFAEEPFINSILSADPFTSERLFAEIFHPSEFRFVNRHYNLPIIIARGENDRIISQSSSLSLARKLNAKYQEIAMSGHTPMIEQVAGYNDILKYLLTRKLR